MSNTIIYTPDSAHYIETSTLLSIRLAQYPDGSVRTQGAYQWTQGFSGGIVWKDVPVVMVDVNGQEVGNE